jgi:hypothetical protein
MNSLVISNPAGLWALLGIPAILLIHFLQRQSRRVTAGTLFLLEQLAPESASGRRFERLRNSSALWLQLLAVVLFAWLLAGVRWLRPDSVQRVVFVLDSSASLSAFADEARKAVAEKSAVLDAAAARTEWTLLETLPARKTLFAGTGRDAMLSALDRWHPDGPSHDPEPALRAALGLVRGRGLVALVTDHASAVPPGAAVLAVGSPIENAGFTGLRADGATWRVLVRNSGEQAVRRAWTIDGRHQGVLDLAPGGMSELRGDFPPGVDRLTLALEPDRFALDDTLPMVRPQPKRIGIFPQPGTPFDGFFEKFTGTVADRLPDGRDVSLVRYDPFLPKLPDGNAIVFVEQPLEPGKLLAGNIVAENHPLVAGLNWQQLLVNETFSIAPRDSDERLVSQGDHPLLLLRHGANGSALIVNFDLRHSNAARLPAFLLTLHRFVESVRAARPDTETLNAETGQHLAGGRRAPDAPGFFDLPGVRGAAHFADGRESDFSGASSADGVSGAAVALRLQNSEQDFLTPLWTILLLCVCGGSWVVAGGGSRSSKTLSKSS